MPARRVVTALGGRYSAELGVDVGAGDAETERWFLAATLFGARIVPRIAERAFGRVRRRRPGDGVLLERPELRA